MSGLFQKKEKLYREPVRWKKELKLAPGYLILTLCNNDRDVFG